MSSAKQVSSAEAFSYHLPPEKIAQRPVYPYDAAKLLVVDRPTAALAQANFSHIADFLRAGDLLIFNNTRVIAARLFGKLADSEREIEILLLEQQAEPGSWKCLGRPLKKLKLGKRINFGESLGATVGERCGDKEILIHFDAEQLPEQQGIMPIPPYIRSGRADARDVADYQPHFAEVSGSVAAPTASLHFTPELVEQLRAQGIQIDFLTLHVGAASFLPLFSEGQEQFTPPGEERYIYSKLLLMRAARVKENGGRVIAVGTTCVRALESMAGTQADEGEQLKTDLFISPGYEFQLIDGIVTNFHQPATTHLLLVQAFLGRELLESSYKYALEHEFRFLSYGDGMLLL